MSIIWLKSKGVPKILKNIHGLCEFGSTLGLHNEADMGRARNALPPRRSRRGDSGGVPTLTPPGPPPAFPPPLSPPEATTGKPCGY
jgi:hypothetical protein